jgi:hypothetical protein
LKVRYFPDRWSALGGPAGCDAGMLLACIVVLFRLPKYVSEKAGEV